MKKVSKVQVVNYLYGKYGVSLCSCRRALKMDGEGDGAIEQASEAEECVSCFGFYYF